MRGQRLAARRGSSLCACGEDLARRFFPWGHLARCPVEQARVNARFLAQEAGKDAAEVRRAENTAVHAATRSLHAVFPDGGPCTFWDPEHAEWVAYQNRPEGGSLVVAVSGPGASREDAVFALLEEVLGKPPAGREPGS